MTFKKNLTKALTLGIIFLLNFQTVLAAFSDLSETHKNYTAITYLQKEGILNGYPDGTFRPDNSVNRAEFLKIILAGSKVPLDTTKNTPFSDINHSAWYAPYVKKAYSEGWIIGYNDGTFKPEQTINKVEALKILGEVQNWNLPLKITEKPYSDTPTLEWYTKYVSYAKEQNYLEETGKFFSPGALMTRAKISEIIYRTLVDDDEDEDEAEDEAEDTVEEEPTEEEPVTENFTPVSYQNISQTYFANITLDETLPTNFYKNEVFVVSGQLTTNNYDQATVILDSTSDNINEYQTFTVDTTNNRFEIPIHFRDAGNFNIGILPGESGQTKVTKISVLSDLPATTNEEAFSEKASSQNIKFQENKTSITFSAPEKTLKKVSFSQNGKEVKYYSRQNINKIAVNYSDFENFNTSNVDYKIELAKLKTEKPLTISSAFTNAESKTFTPTKHLFSTIDKTTITAAPPETLNSVQSISFSGTLKTDTQKTAYVIKPNGFVEEFDLTSSGSTYSYIGQTILKSGSSFSYNYTPTASGTYIVEISNKEGIPIINHTVYIGSQIPLLPDFFDLQERKLFSGSLNLSNARTELLSYINKEREAHGLNKITTTSELNTLAQNHSDDMAQNNFFGHVNLQNETPEDRRKELGIKTPVSENLAKDVAIDFGHEGLMRSASHRQNILKADWTKVGLGLTLKNGYIYIAEEFTTDELTTSDLTEMKTELFSEINKKRETNSLTTLIVNSSLESVSDFLNDKVIQENKELTQEVFEEALDTFNISGNSQTIGRTYNIWSTILTSILNEEAATLLTSTWKSVGIDIQLDNAGSINTIVTLNDK